MEQIFQTTKYKNIWKKNVGNSMDDHTRVEVLRFGRILYKNSILQFSEQNLIYIKRY